MIKNTSSRFPIPILHQIRKNVNPSPIFSENGEKRPTDPMSGFTTIKFNWLISYTIIALFILISLIYGAAISSSGIILYMIVASCLFFVGEMVYSRFLVEYLFQIQSSEPVPAKEPFNKDNIDFHDSDKHVVAGHHFVSVAGVAPIVGPAQAVYFGWLPCILWVVFGSIFCGSPADMGATILGTRNNGKSIADLAGPTISKRSGFIFVLLLVLLCWLIIAVFANLIAGLWMSYPSSVLPVNIEILIALTLAFLWKKFHTSTMQLASSLFVLVFLYIVIFFSVWLSEVAGNPFKMDWLGCTNSVLPGATCSFGEQQFWTLWIGIYVTIVSAIPVWLVVQPRDTINSHQLVVTMVLTILGIIVGGAHLTFPAIRSGLDPKYPVFPYLFVTIACGAISGFHSIVGSINTSKQLPKMTTARSVGYGSMLMEACLATLAIVVVCSTASEENSFSTWAEAGADGMGNFVEGASLYFNKLGIGIEASRTIVSVMVVSFGATTVDTCGRIVRMLVSEFAGYVEMATGVTQDGVYKENLSAIRKVIKGASTLVRNNIIGSLIAIVPSIILCNTSVVNSLWTLFGATNQVVAALSLLISGVYIVRLNKRLYKGIFYFTPFIFVCIACLYALVLQIIDWINLQSNPETYLFINNSVLIAAFCIFIITVWIVGEAIIWLFQYMNYSNSQSKTPEQANFVAWNPKDNRTGYYRSSFPIGFESTHYTEEEVMKSASVSSTPNKSLFQRVIGENSRCC